MLKEKNQGPKIVLVCREVVLDSLGLFLLVVFAAAAAPFWERNAILEKQQKRMLTANKLFERG